MSVAAMPLSSRSSTVPIYTLLVTALRPAMAPSSFAAVPALPSRSKAMPSLANTARSTLTSVSRPWVPCLSSTSQLAPDFVIWNALIAPV